MKTPREQLRTSLACTWLLCQALSKLLWDSIARTVKYTKASLLPSRRRKCEPQTTALGQHSPASTSKGWGTPTEVCIGLPSATKASSRWLSSTKDCQQSKSTWLKLIVNVQRHARKGWIGAQPKQNLTGTKGQALNSLCPKTTAVMPPKSLNLKSTSDSQREGTSESWIR